MGKQIEYSNGELTIVWQPELCRHAGICVKTVNSTLAVSNIRNRTYTNCEVYLIDYGYGNFKEKIHFME